MMPGRDTMRRTAAASLLAVATLAGGLDASAQNAPALNFYGVPGLIDMPSGEMLPDAQIGAALAWLPGTLRASATFQFAPRLSLTLRYARLSDWQVAGETEFDRSVDLRFGLIEEGPLVPAVAIGLQDLLGSGPYAAEYIAATKHFGDRLKVTAGLGWGRLGSQDPLFRGGSRPVRDADDPGGRPDIHAWFRGPAAAFAGVEWQASDRLGLKVEYSSDAYEREVATGQLHHRSPFNFGAEYQLNRAIRLGAYYLYGDVLGVSAQLSFNPRRANTIGSVARAPLPVKPRDRAAADSWGTDWAAEPANLAQLRKVTAKAMANDGMVLEAMTITGTSAAIRLRNPTYDAEPMAIGRAVRALTYILPPSVETITVVPVVSGVAAAAVTFRRSDIERLEPVPDGTEQSLARARFTDGYAFPARLAETASGTFPRFSWSIDPYLSVTALGNDDGLTGSAGLRVSASYEPLPGLVFSGTLAQRLYDNYGTPVPSTSDLPHVRSDVAYYVDQGRFALERLTGAYYFRPGPDLYGRVSAGYLERMFGGVSAELLWKPVDSRLALGAELDWVKQRAYDGGFGFRDYSVATGHVSAYYQFDSGYGAAIHAGRYLAGDWGATVQLSREFANGWKIGAYATFTDVSFKEFGDGSFGKGVTISIPMAWLSGKPTRSRTGFDFGTAVHDAGQRLDVDGRLYDQVRDWHRQQLGREWGMFWR